MRAVRGHGGISGAEDVGGVVAVPEGASGGSISPAVRLSFESRSSSACTLTLVWRCCPPSVSLTPGKDQGPTRRARTTKTWRSRPRQFRDRAAGSVDESRHACGDGDHQGVGHLKRGPGLMYVTAGAQGGPEPGSTRPIVVRTDRRADDRVFRSVVRAAGFGSLVLLFFIGLFLLLRGLPALHVMGWRFFTKSGYQTLGNHPMFGVLASLYGSVVVAIVALVVGVPIALTTSLFLSEYAPTWSRRTLIALVDLAAAMPSVDLRAVGLLRAATERRRVSAPGSHGISGSSRCSRSSTRPPTLRCSSRDRRRHHDRADHRLHHPRSVLPGPARGA